MLALNYRATVLGRRAFRLDGGRSGAVAVRLSAGARRLLAARRTLTVVAIVSAQDTAGNRSTVRRRVLIR